MSEALYQRYKDALRRGHVAALRNRPEAALIAYAEAAEMAPDRALPHASIGTVLRRLGRLDESLAAYGAALDRAPDDEAALAGRAETLIAATRRIEAAETLDRLATVLETAGRLADACDAARRALELAESKPRRRHVEDLAERLRSIEGDPAAAEALDRALQLLAPPIVPEPSAPQGDADGAAGDGIGALEEPAEPTPDPVALIDAAEAALDAGDAAAATAGFIEAAFALGKGGMPNAALDACYEALAVAPADADLHLALVRLYIERGWRPLAAEKLALLGRIAGLTDDGRTRDRVCAMVVDHFADDERLLSLCAEGLAFAGTGQDGSQPASA